MDVEVCFHALGFTPFFILFLSKGIMHMRSLRSNLSRAGFSISTILLLSALSGCGHSNAAMAAQQKAISLLKKDLKKTTQKYKVLRDACSRGQGQLESMLASKDKELSLSAAQIAACHQSEERLAALENRFRDLKSRLEKLKSIGVEFVVRDNRMVIQMPGDVLFDSGKDMLKAEGKKILLQVAEIITQDPALLQRRFQVAGHTDNAPYPKYGPYKDNLGLSLARARNVVMFLTTPSSAKVPGGSLPTENWSASGYGDIDPAVGTRKEQTSQEMTKNRRVELVLVPDVNEMLNLTQS